MKPIEVEDFLDLNGWKFYSNFGEWGHFKIPSKTIHKGIIDLFPDNEYRYACDLMNQYKVAIKYLPVACAQSQAHQPQQAVLPVPQPASGVINPSYTFTSCIVFKTTTCDCGAVKCKTTHVEWCSTMKGNQNGK
jgi:hypothetical protein